jgi:hypothetical protein
MSSPATSAPPPVLTPGQWEAVLFATPQPIKHLVMLLAVHHGHLAPPSPAECPLCGKRDAEGQQEKLFG